MANGKAKSFYRKPVEDTEFDEKVDLQSSSKIDIDKIFE